MKALNRKEVLVNAKANGTLDSFKPLTRDEAFTKKALGLGGDSGGVLVVLTWDEEQDTYISSMSANEIGELIYSGVNVNVVNNYGEWLPFSKILKYEDGQYAVIIHQLHWDYGNVYGFSRIDWSLNDTRTTYVRGGITMLGMMSVDNKPYAVGITAAGELATQLMG